MINLNIIGSIGNTIYVEDIIVKVEKGDATSEVSIKEELINNNWARHSKKDEDDVRQQLEFIAPNTKVGFHIVVKGNG